jgi:hydrogenase maturation factor
VTTDDRSPSAPHDAPLPAGKLPGDLLARLVETYGSRDPAVVVGPGRGRDAAALAVGGATLAIKTDPITFATDRAAHYLVEVNANDLACLGATPRWMLVTLLLPEGRTTPTDVETQFRDLFESCAARGISLVGGHTEITLGLDRPILVGTLFGEVAAGRLLKPGGARPGDKLLLTKGIAIEGTALLARELGSRLRPVLGDDLVDRAAHLLLEPGISIVPDAVALLDAGGVTALHDPTEGGLAVGVRELADAAGCGATIIREKIPVLPETEAVCGALGLDPIGLLASGSLLVAAAPAATRPLIAAGAAAGLPVKLIGEVTAPERGFVLVQGGKPGPLPDFVSDEVTKALGVGY